MGYTYWKANLKYGHVGVENEVTVTRYIQMSKDANIIDVWNLVSKMPGVKKNLGVRSVNPIDEITYHRGKRLEERNFYLQKLKTFKSKVCS